MLHGKKSHWHFWKLFSVSLWFCLSAAPPGTCPNVEWLQPPPPAQCTQRLPAVSQGRVGLSCSGAGADSGADSRDFPLQQ